MTLNIATWNCTGIMSSASYLSDLLDQHSIDICGISEHWLYEYDLKFFNCINNAMQILYFQLMLVSGSILEVSLEEFELDGCIFSEGFSGFLSTRTAFLTQWKKLSCEKKNAEQRANVTSNGIIDQVLKGSFVGTYEVHIGNLIGPGAGRSTREVDYRHVADLESSYQHNACGQLVVLVGMLPTTSVPVNLSELGATKLETLGGNHSRLALQSLLEKGLLSSPLVQVHVYKPLGRTEALAIGLQHNVVLEEKRKPLSFVDKVKLMRECRPSEAMSTADVVSWKDMLCVVFRMESRRKLQMTMSRHLQMAKLPEEIFNKVLLANVKTKIHDKFFRSMLKLDSDEAYSCCLDVLVSKGAGQFNAKVKEYLDQGLARSKSKKKDPINEVIVENDDVLQETEAPETVESLKETVSALQAEKQKMEEELEKLREANKRKREEQTREVKPWNVGEVVEAKWKDDSFYAAKIEKVETLYHVVFLEDKKKRKVSEQELRLQ